MAALSSVTPANPSTDSVRSIFTKMEQCDLADIKGISQEILNQRVKNLFSTLAVHEKGEAIKYILSRAMQSQNPKLAIAVMNPDYQNKSEFRSRLCLAYIEPGSIQSSTQKADLKKFATFLKAAIEEGNPILIKECYLSLTIFAMEHSGGTNYRSIVGFYRNQVIEHGPFHGLFAVLQDNLLGLHTDPFPYDETDGWTLLYSFIHVSPGHEKFAVYVQNRLESQSKDVKIEACLRLLKYYCKLNEMDILDKVIIPTLNKFNLIEDESFKYRLAETVIQFFSEKCETQFLNCALVFFNKTPRSQKDENYLLVVTRVYLENLPFEQGATVNTLLTMAHIFDNVTLTEMCVNTIEQRSLHSYIEIDKLLASPILKSKVIPQTALYAKDALTHYSFHIVVLKVQSSSLGAAVNFKSEAPMVLDISPEGLRDIEYIIHRRFWIDEKDVVRKYNPQWSLQTMVEVYRFSNLWNISEGINCCFRYLTTAQFTRGRFQEILDAFKTMSAEELEKKLKEHNVFLV